MYESFRIKGSSSPSFQTSSTAASLHAVLHGPHAVCLVLNSPHYWPKMMPCRSRSTAPPPEGPGAQRVEPMRPVTLRAARPRPCASPPTAKVLSATLQHRHSPRMGTPRGRMCDRCGGEWHAPTWHGNPRLCLSPKTRPQQYQGWTPPSQAPVLQHERVHDNAMPNGAAWWRCCTPTPHRAAYAV